jgi:hypothetical protein
MARASFPVFSAQFRNLTNLNDEREGIQNIPYFDENPVLHSQFTMATCRRL